MPRLIPFKHRLLESFSLVLVSVEIQQPLGPFIKHNRGLTRKRMELGTVTSRYTRQVRGGIFRKVWTLKVRNSELFIEPGGTQGTISEINTLIQMPQTHCFPKHRDLRPSGFYAAAKDLGQNQSFKDFLLKKFKDSLASSQVWSDLFAFPLGTLRQVRNWPATTVRVTHSPVGPFFLAFTM